MIATARYCPIGTTAAAPEYDWNGYLYALERVAVLIVVDDRPSRRSKKPVQTHRHIPTVIENVATTETSTKTDSFAVRRVSTKGTET